MKNNNKIYALFIFIALCFWNPISAYFIYKSSGVENFEVLLVLFSIVFLFGIVVMLLTYFNKLSNWIINTIFTVSITGILFFVFVFINHLIGIYIFINGNTPASIRDGLIFKPFSKAIYKTDEFYFTAEINSIGLRDTEISITKENTYRILCFGDSWTYGWGVKAEDSWPKKLEKFLKKRGYDYVEVINCGQPGQYTFNYKINMEKSVPLLKPDLVLLGVLQGDDLAQIYENEYFNNRKKINIYSIINQIKQTVIKLLNVSFNNIVKLLKKERENTIDITLNWKNDCKNKIQHFDNRQKLIYNSFYNSVKERFESGNLNPGYLRMYVDLPERHLIFNDPLNTATSYSINKMEKDISDMKIICDYNNSKLIFINLPIPDFTGHNVTRTPSIDILNKYLVEHNNIDSIYKSVASNSNISYFELTTKFKGLTDKSGYFIKYDGHPNEKGYEVIANAIGEYIIAENVLQENNK